MLVYQRVDAGWNIAYQLMSRNSYKLQGTFSTHQLFYQIVGKQHRKMIHFTWSAPVVSNLSALSFFWAAN